MPHPFEFKQSGHLDPALTDPAAKTSNADKLVGRWSNTNRETRGVAEITIERDGDGRFRVSALGVGDGRHVEWPRTEARVLANLEEEAGQRTVALAADFDFGFMTAETYLRVNKGVLVIVYYNTFRDGTGRADYVNREFFYRRD
jgi:hypothetical protein